MFVPETQDLSPDDYKRVANHIAYLATVRSNDPQRAAILRDLVLITYKYGSIAAADILLMADYELHTPVHVTA